ncbi:hypothetical protein [Amycolatopsis sp. CA-128772]|uniref:hypothetical protein n=1 Tax=Amycolatopsis sp. CA-128772 TaxID=2073159 RepID=UPI0011B06360|nr:hypothetical protein [Amycolatopsis sp. CA-128772]
MAGHGVQALAGGGFEPGDRVGGRLVDRLDLATGSASRIGSGSPSTTGTSGSSGSAVAAAASGAARSGAAGTSACSEPSWETTFATAALPAVC